jgi:hypothetical protein
MESPPPMSDQNNTMNVPTVNKIPAANISHCISKALNTYNVANFIIIQNTSQVTSEKKKPNAANAKYRHVLERNDSINSEKPMPCLYDMMAIANKGAAATLVSHTFKL